MHRCLRPSREAVGWLTLRDVGASRCSRPSISPVLRSWGDGVIDGRGGEKLLGRDVSPWDLAEQARPDGHQQVSRILVADYADDFTLYRITLRNSPNFHVVYNHGDGFTVWSLKIDTPKRLARNTDGVDPGGGSKNITITHSYIRTGDDNVAIKGGTGGLTQMTVSHNHFYWGHGMSIGSETNGGVSKIRIFDLALDGPDNGIRIKSNGSRGGLTHDVVYDDVCVRDSPNPITFDTGYSAAGTLKGDLPPTMKDVTLHDVRVSGGGKLSFNGYAKQYRVGVNLDGVLLTDDAEYKYSVNHADLHLGPGPVNLKLPAGDDSTITGTPGQGKPASCAEKFCGVPGGRVEPLQLVLPNPGLDLAQMLDPLERVVAGGIGLCVAEQEGLPQPGCRCGGHVGAAVADHQRIGQREVETRARHGGACRGWACGPRARACSRPGRAPGGRGSGRRRRTRCPRGGTRSASRP